MPLIQCPDCGKDVSDAAPSCIHCGRPAKKKTQPIVRQPLPPRDAPRPMEKESGGVTNFRKMEPAAFRYQEPPPSAFVAAFCSFVITGLGQLIQKRYAAAAGFFCAASVCGILSLVVGPVALIGNAIILVWAVADAAMWGADR